MIKPEQWAAYLSAYRQSRHQGASAALAGIAVATVTRRQREDPEFLQQVTAAAMALDGEVQARAINVALAGAPREAILPSGEVVTLRSYCPKTTLTYLERYCGWGETPDTLEAGEAKSVQLIGENHRPMGMLDILRQGVNRHINGTTTNGTTNNGHCEN